jgi:hypothetical protein
MRSAVVLVAVVLAGSAVADPAWTDAPAWPASGAASLTWRVSPADRNAKSPVELVVAIGGVQRSVKLAPQLGQMPAIYEHVCDSTAVPLRRGEVAQLTFEEGGFGGYVARVTGSALEIVEWNMSDGMCGTLAKPVPCPRHDTLAARMHVPEGVKLVEHVELVDKHGARRPFVCN